MARKATIIGAATDWQGERWDVRERRLTKHGFDVLIGWPSSADRGKGGRGVATIPTAELVNYLTNTRPKDMDLPIGLTVIKRIRKVLDVRWSYEDWWSARSSDLLTMTLESFCNKHGASMGAASQWRKKFKHD